MLAVRAADIMLWCAFVPMALLAWDNLIVPPFNMFIESDAGTGNDRRSNAWHLSHCHCCHLLPPARTCYKYPELYFFGGCS